MKHVSAALLALALLAGNICSAEAIVCARGVHRAGCVGPRGAVVVRPAHRHCHYHRGVRVCR
jgi:hypothetical protein